MAKTFEEMHEFLGGRQSEFTARTRLQNQQRAEVGKVMSELIADPRWQLYVRHLEEQRRRADALVNRYTAEILNGPCVSHDTYAQQKAELAKSTGARDAFNTAINLAQELIEEGNRATKELSDGH